jgi:putative addiction module killer protein
MYELQQYVRDDGKSPFREWFISLKDITTRNRIRTKIDLLAVGSNSHVRPLGQGLYELKIDFGPGYRAYFGRGENNIILFLGGNKKSQKEDIALAKRYWAEYKRGRKL